MTYTFREGPLGGLRIALEEPGKSVYVWFRLFPDRAVGIFDPEIDWKANASEHEWVGEYTRSQTAGVTYEWVGWIKPGKG